MSVKNNSGYIKYLAFIDIKNSLLEKYQLNGRQEKIVQYLISEFHYGNRVKVVDLLRYADIASPATIHKDLQNLVKLKLVHSILDIKDKRVRHLKPSRIAFQLYEDIGKEL